MCFHRCSSCGYEWMCNIKKEWHKFDGNKYLQKKHPAHPDYCNPYCPYCHELEFVEKDWEIQAQIKKEKKAKLEHLPAFESLYDIYKRERGSL